MIKIVDFELLLKNFLMFFFLKKFYIDIKLCHKHNLLSLKIIIVKEEL